MAKILICTGVGQPIYCSNMALIHALRTLGHDICVVGPGYWGRFDADILLEDKPHPELYTYEEVLTQCPWQPDLVLNIEPHMFLSGKKPAEIVSAFYATDQHCAGQFYYQVVFNGSFDFYFVGQPWFANLYYSLPNTRVIPLPIAFDTRRFDRNINLSPHVDIAFCGVNGIANMEYPHKDGYGKYATHPPKNLPDGIARYEVAHIGHDYCQRAEMLIRLCKDFNVRMYKDVWETPNFSKALQTGVIGFNRSLLGDIASRCFEVMAARRLLITDFVPFQKHYFTAGKHCLEYGTYYLPFFPNFSLEYKFVKDMIRTCLNTLDYTGEITFAGYEHVWAHHTWQHRAGTILENALN